MAFTCIDCERQTCLIDAMVFNLAKFPSLTLDTMFDGPYFPTSLDEEVFNNWLESGRSAKIGYNYLLIVWDEYESTYRPVYVARRDEMETYKSSSGRERFIAAYDLYSESRIS